ncbi:DUF58 domain-containing protein [Patescibacteria group bacterium]|nr:DUF58 domain-containing protein [Patescibacteria group bacterium]
MESKRLNLNIPQAVSDFERAAKKLEIINVLYKIVFRGSGLEFDSYRDYDSSDDSSSIDWKASKRAGKLLVKRYIEERDLKIILAIDISERMVFGSTKKLKCEYVAELAAAISHLILISGDNLGFVLYNDDIVQFVPPNKSPNQFHLFVDLLSDSSLYTGDSNLNHTLDYLLKNLDPSTSAIIFVSDFLNTSKECQRNFNLLSSKFEIIALVVKDPLDKALPDIDREIFIEHPASGETVLINPKVSGKIYEKMALEQEKFVEGIFKATNIDSLQLTTDRYFIDPLVGFLKERIKKRSFRT